MTAVFDSPSVVAFDHDEGFSEAVFFENLLEHMRAGILTANSWLDLEDWLSQADLAFDLGELTAEQVETLAGQAIEVSRGIPEQ